MSEFSPPPDYLSLTDGEKNSGVWLKIKAFLEEQNNRDRRRNDDMTLTKEETRNLRAMIAARKSLLNLDH